MCIQCVPGPFSSLLEDLGPRLSEQVIVIVAVVYVCLLSRMCVCVCMCIIMCVSLCMCIVACVPATLPQSWKLRGKS